jgi:hypothetical protein
MHLMANLCTRMQRAAGAAAVLLLCKLLMQLSSTAGALSYI